MGHKDVCCGKREPSTLRSEVAGFKNTVNRVFESHWSSGLYTLKLCLPDNLGDSLKRFRSLMYTNAGTFEHFNLLLKQSSKTGSQKLSTRIEKTVENIRSALRNVQRPKNEGKRGTGEQWRAKELKWLERRGECLVRVGAQLAVEQFWRAAENANTELPSDSSSARVLAMLLRKEVLGCFRRCLRGWVCAMDENSWEEYVLMRLVKSRYILKRYCPSLSQYDENENLTREERTESCAKHDERTYASRKCRGGKRKMNCFVLLRVKAEERERCRLERYHFCSMHALGTKWGKRARVFSGHGVRRVFT